MARFLDRLNAGGCDARVGKGHNLEAALLISRLVGAVEFQFTGMDRVVNTKVVRVREPASAELAGDLAAAGRRVSRLASEGLTRVVSER
jgi:hypothetical protein